MRRHYFLEVRVMSIDDSRGPSTERQVWVKRLSHDGHSHFSMCSRHTLSRAKIVKLEHIMVTVMKALEKEYRI